MKSLALLLVLFSANTMAVDVIRGVMTRHTMISEYEYNGTTRNFNESNELVGINTKTFSLATMKNSYYKRAVIGLYTPFQHQYIDFKIGASTGYSHVLPQISYKGLTPVFSVGAKYKKINVSLFMLSAVVVTYGVEL